MAPFPSSILVKNHYSRVSPDPKPCFYLLVLSSSSVVQGFSVRLKTWRAEVFCLFFAEKSGKKMKSLDAPLLLQTWFADEECSFIFELELVPSCLINSDLEPLSLDLELLEIIILASSLDHLFMNLTQLERVAPPSSKPAFIKVDSKNLLDRISSCTSLFTLPERLKADNTLRLNHLIHIESRKSPTVVLFDVDTGRISIRHCEMLKSITLNVLARSQG
ncbi:hypothetical protein Tco_0793030 [Tanacetum coccineum]